MQGLKKRCGHKKDVGKMMAFCPFDGSVLPLQREML